MKLSSCGFVGVSRGDCSFNLSNDRRDLGGVFGSAAGAGRGLNPEICGWMVGSLDEESESVDLERPWAIEGELGRTNPTCSFIGYPSLLRSTRQFS